MQSPYTNMHLSSVVNKHLSPKSKSKHSTLKAKHKSKYSNSKSKSKYLTLKSKHKSKY